jgi:hypothetical protein
MEKDEDAASENQAGQGSGHLLCEANGEDQQREDAFRQGVRTELDARIFYGLEILGQIVSARVRVGALARRVK